MSRIANRILPRYKKRYRNKDCKIHRSTNIAFPRRLSLGRYVYMGPNCFINAEGGLIVGDGSIFAPEVVVLTSTHDIEQPDSLPYGIYDIHKKTEIGRGVWIGYRAMIAPGVEIGDGAVIAMGAVVVNDVPTGMVVGGNPAKPLKQRPVELIETLTSKNSYLHNKYRSNSRPKIKK